MEREVNKIMLCATLYTIKLSLWIIPLNKLQIARGLINIHVHLY